MRQRVGLVEPDTQQLNRGAEQKSRAALRNSSDQMNSQNHEPKSPSRDTTGAWIKILAQYRQPRFGRSVFELVVTAVPFAAFWAGACIFIMQGSWLGALLILPAAAFLLRLFM